MVITMVDVSNNDIMMISVVIAVIHYGYDNNSYNQYYNII